MLLDPALGPAGQQAPAAITGICGGALHAVLGPGLAQATLAGPDLLTRIAPWARDLARGLQYRDRYGAVDPATADLISRLADRPVPGSQVSRLAEAVDLAVVLTLSRVTDQVPGPGRQRPRRTLAGHPPARLPDRPGPGDPAAIPGDLSPYPPAHRPVTMKRPVVTCGTGSSLRATGRYGRRP